MAQTISMYGASVPVLTRGLNNLKQLLTKGEAHALAKKIDPQVFLNARLAPDMLPLTKQIQIATDNAKGIAARLAGVSVPSYADDEASFAQLYARIDKTLEFLSTFKPTQFDGAEDRDVTLPVGGGNTLQFKGLPYLLGFAIPNFLFHVVTAYNILRHNGVEIGKRDYLGPPG